MPPDGDLPVAGRSGPVRRRRRRRPEVATQWQLMWWKLRKHHLALVGLVALGFLALVSLFAEVIAPVSPQARNPRYLAGPPMGIHFVDRDGSFHLRPFVYGRTTERDPTTLRKVAVVQDAVRWPVRFLVPGDSYRLWGLIELDVHLFGVQGGFLHLFGTDTLGRDLFTRTLHATRVSLSVGLVGVSLAFALGAVIGGDRKSVGAERVFSQSPVLTALILDTQTATHSPKLTSRYLSTLWLTFNSLTDR